MKKERNLYVDFIKGILIFLVILGHFVQFGAYGKSWGFASDHLWQIIYSFHMPLFIAISGYYSFSSIKGQSVFSFLKSRILYLFVPMFVWCFIHATEQSLMEHNTNIIELFKTLIFRVQYIYWFIWAIIFFSTILCFMQKLKIDNVFVLALSVILIFLIPSGLRYFSIAFIKEFYIFFVLGYILATFNIQPLIEWCKKYSLLIIIISTLCFVLFWTEKTSYYVTPFSVDNIGIELFRIFETIAVSVSFMLLSYYVYSYFQNTRGVRLCAEIGMGTLGIYLMQNIFFYPIVVKWHNDFIPDWSIVYVIPSIVFVVFAYYIIIFTSKNKYAAFLLYGKKIRAKVVDRS